MEKCEFGNARLYGCVSRPSNQCRRIRYKLPGPGGTERGPGPDYIAYVFVFLGTITICRLGKLILLYQARLSATDSQSFRFSVTICSWATLAGGGSRKIFNTGVGPTPGGPASNYATN